MNGRQQRGVNLVELVIAIVIISIAAVGVMMVYAQAVRFSADPMIEQQAAAIAEGYLDEILARPVADPDGTNAGESRATYDDVADYAAIVNESPPQDQNGNVSADLAGYSVTVTVDLTVPVGPVGAQVQMAQVDVHVRYATVVDIRLTGYRAN